MPHNHNSEDDSDIPEVKMPENGFQSDLPVSLLKDCTPKDRYLYEKLGEMEHFIKWSAPIMVNTNLQVRKTNGRVNKAEENIIQLQEDSAKVKKTFHLTRKIFLNKYTITISAICLFVMLFPLYGFITAHGGPLDFALDIIKALIS